MRTPYDATGFTASSTNAGSAGVNGAGAAFNEIEGAGGNDTIIGNGNTRIAFYDATAGVTVTFTSLGAGTSQSTASGDAAGVGIDTFSGVNSVRGSAFDDIIGPDAGNNVFDGQAGNDTLQGGGGNDTLIGGDGIDRALYIDATGPITVNMAAGTVSGAGVGSDTLSSVESIRGSAFADNYVATGYNGASAIGSLPSTFNEFEGMAGNDVIVGFEYHDLVPERDWASDGQLHFGVAGQARGTATGDASVGTDTFTGVQFVRGSSFADTLLGSNNLTGVEVFEGRGGNDFIDGRGGFDRAVYEFRTDDNVTSGIIVNLAAGTVTVVAGDTSIGTRYSALDRSRCAEPTSLTSLTPLALPRPAPMPVAPESTVMAQHSNEFEGLGGNDTIIGNGNTRISFINAADGVTVDLASPTPGVSGSTGIAHGTAPDDVAGIGTDTIFGGVNSIIGSFFADTFFGSNNGTAIAEVFDGGAGNDTFDGRGGFDVAVYNNDVGTASGISVNMAAGTVTGDASIGTDTLISIESVRGTNFDDTYVATGFNGASSDIPSGTTFNEFEGMDGNDIITGNGNTRISYLNASAGVTVTLSGSGSGTAQSTAAGDARQRWHRYIYRHQRRTRIELQRHVYRGCRQHADRNRWPQRKRHGQLLGLHDRFDGDDHRRHAGHRPRVGFGRCPFRYDFQCREFCRRYRGRHGHWRWIEQHLLCDRRQRARCVRWRRRQTIRPIILLTPQR